MSSKSKGVRCVLSDLAPQERREKLSELFASIERERQAQDPQEHPPCDPAKCFEP
jgi:hypothetical protein